MASQVDEMRRLVESLIASAEGVVSGEQIRVSSAGEAAAARALQFNERAATVDGFINGLSDARVESSAADSAARADAEGLRREQAASDAQARADDFAQMSVDVNMTVAGMTATRSAQATADWAARTDAEALRTEQAEADAQARAAQFAQMSADVDAQIAELQATRAAQAAADAAA
ncbi:MAG: hypothetical protein WCI74_03805, partial [Actinomycetes bacterium]